MFDVEQAGFAESHHVFVDVRVACADVLASPVGVPTGVSVLEGFSGIEFLDEIHSSYCSAAEGASVVTSAVSVAGGCRTVVSAVSSKLTREGVTTHVLEVPDDDIGKDRQLFVWVDANANGAWNAGERFDLFPSDFASREPDDSGFHVYEYPSDFEVQLLLGSTTVGRAGQESELRLRLVAPTDRVIGHHFGQSLYARDPIVDEPVGARVYTGPSSTQTVVCFNTGAAAAAAGASSCVTDDNGEFIVRYTVDAVPFFAMQQDELVVFHDRDRDGRHDITQPNHPAPEASSRIALPIAKAANYIALGDSYSSGENGATPTPGPLHHP